MGHWIAQGTSKDPKGFRTIMAYEGKNHSTRVNYYSNPAVILPATGTPTGLVTANNAAILLMNRFSAAAVGNESSATCRLGKAKIAAKPNNATQQQSATLATAAPATKITPKPVKDSLPSFFKCMFTVYFNSTWRISDLDDTEKCLYISQILGMKVGASDGI